MKDEIMLHKRLCVMNAMALLLCACVCVCVKEIQSAPFLGILVNNRYTARHQKDVYRQAGAV